MLSGITSSKPDLLPHWKSPQDYITQARNIIQKAKPASTQQKPLSIAFNEKELAIASNYILNRFTRGRARVSIEGNRLTARATLRIPRNPFGRYLNLKMTVVDKNGAATLQRLKLGKVTIAPEIASWLGPHLISQTPIERLRKLFQVSMTRVNIAQSQLTIHYLMTLDAIEQASTIFPNRLDERRLLVYQDKVAKISLRFKRRSYVPLLTFIRPLFALANERSKQFGFAIKENKALLFVLTTYVNRKNIKLFLPPTAKPTRPVFHVLTLNRRHDMAQHFTASAALTASGSRLLADFVGLYKEIEDTYWGSGFSFTDLAADRAGTFFGETATESEDVAVALQEVMMSDSLTDNIFMPSIRNLPENLRAEDFKKRFDEVNSVKYQQQIKLIDRRIASCPLYRQIGSKASGTSASSPVFQD